MPNMEAITSALLAIFHNTQSRIIIVGYGRILRASLLHAKYFAICMCGKKLHPWELFSRECRLCLNNTQTYLQVSLLAAFQKVLANYYLAVCKPECWLVQLASLMHSYFEEVTQSDSSYQCVHYDPNILMCFPVCSLCHWFAWSVSFIHLCTGHILAWLSVRLLASCFSLVHLFPCLSIY